MTDKKYCQVCGFPLAVSGGSEYCLYCGYRQEDELEDIDELLIEPSDLAEDIMRNRRIAALCHSALMRNTDGSLDYCLERGISADTAEAWNLGYNRDLRLLPENWFGRLMIPIYGTGHVILGFGGRITDGSGRPKYINSEESRLYKKSGTLFGMDRVLPGTPCVYLCEGYFDVISMYGYGSVPAVASCGTALTKKQAAFLRRNTDRIAIAYDSDDAGRKAVLRAVSVLSMAGFGMSEMSVVTPVDAKDVDEAIRKGNGVTEEELSGYLKRIGRYDLSVRYSVLEREEKP